MDEGNEDGSRGMKDRAFYKSRIEKDEQGFKGGMTRDERKRDEEGWMKERALRGKGCKKEH
eukprot:1136451-Amorphochlora_amoeboformis.AAC.1